MCAKGIYGQMSTFDRHLNGYSSLDQYVAKC